MEEHGALSPVLTTSGAPLFFLRLWRGISCARSWARTSRLRSDSADKKITRSTHRVRRYTAADAPRELAPGHPR
jgi:hypothetical protein